MSARLAVPLLAVGLPWISACDTRASAERVSCIVRDGDATTCTSCPAGFVCHTGIPCGPPVRLDDGGFLNSCHEGWGNPPGFTEECRPLCDDDADCASGEACRNVEGSFCGDVSGNRRLCVPQ